MNFWGWPMKNILVRIWGKPEVLANFSADFGRFRPIYPQLKFQKYPFFGHFGEFSGLFFSKINFGPISPTKHLKWFFSASLAPKDDIYIFLNKFRQTKKNNFSSYSVDFRGFDLPWHQENHWCFKTDNPLLGFCKLKNGMIKKNWGPTCLIFFA